MARFVYLWSHDTNCKLLADMDTLKPNDDKAVLPRICTYTGIAMYPFEPTEAMVRIEDIAHALAAMPRFSGHTNKPYSVAEHSVRVSRMVAPPAALQALLHDSAEAYLLDVPSPLKGHYIGYRDAEKRLLEVIYRALDVTWPIPPAVKVADSAIVLAERRDLLPHVEWWIGGTLPTYSEYPRITPWSAKRAEREFLDRFNELTGEE